MRGWTLKSSLRRHTVCQLVILQLKVSKLLPYPGIQSGQFYHFEGEEVIKFCSLLLHMTELVGMCSFENMAKTDVVLSSS